MFSSFYVSFQTKSYLKFKNKLKAFENIKKNNVYVK